MVPLHKASFIISREIKMKFKKTIKLILKFTTYLCNLIMSQLRVCLLQLFKKYITVFTHQMLNYYCWQSEERGPIYTLPLPTTDEYTT